MADAAPGNSEPIRGAAPLAALRLAAAALAALAGLTAIRLLVAALAPLAPDEAYYWVWSRVLQPGYLDGSPMVAFWIRLGTWLVGPSPLGVRLVGPLAAALGSYLLFRAAADLFPKHPRVGLVAALFINASLLFGAGSVLMTPDTPLLFFWTLGLFSMARVIATEDGRWWLLAGLAAGLALDSKYTGLFFIVAIGIWLIVTDQGRRWLRRPEPWLGLAVALLVFAPVVAWNAEHHWASFLKQGGRVSAWRPADALRFEAELFAGQAGLFTPLVFAFAVVGTWRLALRAWQERESASVLLSLLTLVPALVFVQHALGDRVQGNWPAVVYPSAVIAGATLLAPPWLRLRAPAAILGFFVSGVVYLQALAAPIPIPRRLDPTLRQLAGWGGFAAAVKEAAHRDGARFIATRNYGDASELAFLQAVPVVGLGGRWTLFQLPAAGLRIAGRTGLLIERSGRAPPDPEHWAVLGPPGKVVRARGRIAAETFLVYRVRAKKGVTRAMLPTR
jgi:4-amino-4-deoxy-L-arabinose transferase-like glycosyltransferase